MNIESLARQFLINHNYNESALGDLVSLLKEVASYEGLISDDPEYDSSILESTPCECGHPYYRHFDTYSNMDAVGCKYCSPYYDDYLDGHCAGFKEKK